MGWIESWVTSGGQTGESNRITLLRDASRNGKPQTRSIFLDHLASPFGVALVGSDLYVANTDAVVRYPYNEGDTKITAPGARLIPLPAITVSTSIRAYSRNGRISWKRRSFPTMR